jgi:hypothetical protein
MIWVRASARLRALTVIAVGAGTVLAMAAGCRSTTTTATSGGAPSPASGTPASGGGAGPGAAPSCVVGTWKLSATDTTIGNSMKLSGGSGVTLTVGPAGETTVDYSTMQPLTFSAANVTGSFTFGGKATATMAISGSGASGTWQPKGTPDFSNVTVTEDVTSPTQGRILDHVKIGDASSAANSPLTTMSILSNETFECSGTTLKLRPPSGTAASGAWTFQRA